jgi:tetratricopeptide (TPR) repeat protein
MVRRGRVVLIAAFVLGGLDGQHPPAADSVSVPLDEGRLGDAVEALERGARIDTDPQRLRVCRLLIGLGNEAEPELAQRALLQAVRLSESEAADEHRDEHRALRALAGATLARIVLRAAAGDDPADPDGDTVRRLLAAREALCADEAAHLADSVAVALFVVPRLAALKRYREAVEVGEAVLACELAAADRRALRAELGLVLLDYRKPEAAVVYLADFLAPAPSDPRHVLRVVPRLPNALAADTWRFLLPVVTRRPGDAEAETWTECLRRAYHALDQLDPAEEPAFGIWKRLVVRKPLPQQWDQRIWEPGFRIWLPDDEQPGRASLGRDAVRAALPISAGWTETAAPPPELTRWRNAALCFQRGEHGPMLVVYWFGPNLHYWYGDTDRMKGVTKKTVRGHSAGAIGRMIGDIVYGEHARATGQEFKKAKPLRFPLGVDGTRMAWRSGDVVYDETVFSFGQVTCEVLLRAREQDVELLEPELRWLYRQIRKD